MALTAERNLNTLFETLTRPGSSVASQGFQNLGQIFAGQGRTDPRLFNMQSAGISRDTQALQQALQGSLARGGMLGSGVGQAIGASIGQEGANRQAGLRAQEARLQEDRKRADLSLLQGLILGPAQRQQEFNLSKMLGLAALQNQSFGATLGGLGTLAGGIFGGPIGAGLSSKLFPGQSQGGK